ncbi:NAD(P)H-binding protein [Luteibacter jiangsuensis]|uniref:NAD(P)H-binding protein n=1 Tax=Luteibacter jiangsuensis TaxID=637577 RepID=A0ABX0Q0R9_9GAMM|nr:NAD(P)H-binding protein [Luteibacter jiangsuensis]NID03554.1 NAD(P)H-binding protein [Luteibacter jiangsuensis]
MNEKRKAVVLGGSGMTGAKAVKLLESKGWDVFAASRRTGVDLVTGEGLADAMNGAEVVIDATNVPAYDEETLMNFFANAATHIIPAARAARIRHHVVLSIVGIDTVPHIAYAHGKIAQEQAVVGSGLPYTIVRSTQFFEWLGVMADDFTHGDVAAVPDADLRPVAIDDAVAALVDVAIAPPVHGFVSVAGPEENTFETWIQRYFDLTGDRRTARTSNEATYFGGKIDRRSLVPEKPTMTGPQSFDAWAVSAAGKAALAGNRVG